MMKLSAGVIASLVFASACAPPKPLPPPVRVVGADTIPIPLSEMGVRTYKGLEGGLYPDRSNSEPADHDALGIAHRNAIRPLDVNGFPNGAGHYVLMSIGGAGVSAAWCSVSSAPPCNSWSFTGRATSDAFVNHTALVIVNAALPTATISMWTSPTSANYNRIRDTRLAPLGLSEKQVQAIWMNLADSDSVLPVTASPADAAARLQRLGAAIRALKQRYPNLQLLFVSSPRYAGYRLDGEPLAYESGFAVKWIVESQIDQLRGRAANADAGDLSLARGTPWISWGPYIWTRGEQSRRDGMTWLRADYDSSATRLSRQGEEKLGGILFDFFRNSVYTRCWFLAGPVCG